MDRRQKMMLIALVMGVLLFAMFLLLVPVSQSEVTGTTSNDNANPFLPIWIALFIPILISQRRKQQKTTNQEKEKNSLKYDDRLSMMRDLVHDLDNDELAYLEKRLMAVQGHVLEGELYDDE